ncbi:MAG: fibro-slime domain-containing protein [Phycisphaera sp.]|nr:fibro-slime domain-containing protein [Phycisphaera sp.]
MKHVQARTRRGVAIVLALLAVAAATLLGVTVAATRDAANSSNDTVARNAAARAAAAGGLDLVERLVEDTALFVGNDPGAEPIPLFETVNIGGVMLRAEIRDLETDGPVTAATRAFVTVTEATVGNITQSARAVSQLTQADIVARADLDLSEFAVFATRPLQGTRIRALTGDGVPSTIAAWQTAPGTRLSEPLVIGTHDRRSGDVVVDAGSTALGHTVLDAGAFADSNEARDTDIASGVTRVPVDIHVIPVAMPPTPQQPTASTAEEFLNQVSGDIGNPSTAVDVSMGAGEKAVIDTLDAGAGSWRQLDIGGSLELLGASIRVRVPTLIVVRSDLQLENASIEVDEGASLIIMAQGSIAVAQSYIGARRPPGEGLQTDGHAAYPVGGAGSVAILASQPGAAGITDGSVIKGRLYMPSRSIILSEISAVYGSVVGATVELLGASVFYDPALRSDRGWLNPRSGIYAADGSVRPEVGMISAMTDSAFASFAEATGVAPDLLVASMMPNALASGAGGEGSEDESGDGDGDGGGGGGMGNPVPPTGSLSLSGTLRAIAPAGSANGHPDFASSQIGVAHYIGTVENTLGPDGKPAYRGWTVGGKWRTLKQNFPFRNSAGNHIPPQLFRADLGDTTGIYQSNNKPSATSAATFATWFADGPSVTLSKPFTLTFAANGDGAYTTELSVSPCGETHSTGLEGVTPYFTYEASGQFIYYDHDEAGYAPHMIVEADDDLWIFIDGKLVSDISGVQNQEVEQYIDLTRLGLSNGENYEVKLFYASRKDNASILKIATNIVGSDGDASGEGDGDTALARLRDALEAVQQRLEDGDFDPADARFGNITPAARRNFGAVAMDQDA